MPLYVYGCDKCGSKQELYQPTMEALPPKCCGDDMSKCPTCPSMVKNKGAGGYPSRKFLKGTAPYTQGYRINPAGLDVKKE